MRNSVVKGIIAGAAGGLAATWVMSQFHALIAPPPEEQAKDESGEDATVKTAEAISGKVFHHDLSEEEKKKAGPLVHYAYGTAIGALYGAFAVHNPITTAGFGTGYGAAAWVAGDEVAVPALGLAPKPTEVPLSKHAQELAAHLVYGANLEGVRRGLTKVL